MRLIKPVQRNNQTGSFYLKSHIPDRDIQNAYSSLIGILKKYKLSLSELVVKNKEAISLRDSEDGKINLLAYSLLKTTTAQCMSAEKMSEKLLEKIPIDEHRPGILIRIQRQMNLANIHISRGAYQEELASLTHAIQILINYAQTIGTDELEIVTAQEVLAKVNGCAYRSAGTIWHEARLYVLDKAITFDVKDELSSETFTNVSSQLNCLNGYEPQLAVLKIEPKESEIVGTFVVQSKKRTINSQITSTATESMAPRIYCPSYMEMNVFQEVFRCRCSSQTSIIIGNSFSASNMPVRLVKDTLFQNKFFLVFMKGDYIVLADIGNPSVYLPSWTYSDLIPSEYTLEGHLDAAKLKYHLNKWVLDLFNDSPFNNRYLNESVLFPLLLDAYNGAPQKRDTLEAKIILDADKKIIDALDSESARKGVKVEINKDKLIITPTQLLADYLRMIARKNGLLLPGNKLTLRDYLRLYPDQAKSAD